MMTSQQVVKFWEYCKTDFIFGFPTSKWAGIFECLIVVIVEKLAIETYVSFQICAFTVHKKGETVIFSYPRGTYKIIPNNVQISASGLRYVRITKK